MSQTINKMVKKALDLVAATNQKLLSFLSTGKKVVIKNQEFSD